MQPAEGARPCDPSPPTASRWQKRARSVKTVCVLDKAMCHKVSASRATRQTRPQLATPRSHLPCEHGSAAPAFIVLSQVPFRPDYYALDCPDEFVFGYGMDCNERFRSLPFIAVATEATKKGYDESVETRQLGARLKRMTSYTSEAGLGLRSSDTARTLFSGKWF